MIMIVFPVCVLFIFSVKTSVRQSPDQSVPAIFEIPKSPDHILTLNDLLYHKTYPGHLQVCFWRYFGLPYFRTEVHRTSAIFVEIMSDKVILEHKMSCLVYFENFHFLRFFHLWTILTKNWKNENFQNWPNMTKYDFLWSKMTSSGMI